MSAEILMRKASRAAKSAKLLFDDAGACNRAYYAMFDAATAALHAVGAPTIDGARVAKSHGGLISNFGLHVAKAGHLSLDLGRALNRAEAIRSAADYTEEPVPHEDVEWLVTTSKDFVGSVQSLLVTLEIANTACKTCGANPCICGKRKSGMQP